MVSETTIRRIGNSQGVMVPKRICDELGVGVGTEVSVAAGDGCIIITPKAAPASKRIGAARGRSLVTDEWSSAEFEAEVAADFEAVL